MHAIGTNGGKQVNYCQILMKFWPLIVIHIFDNSHYFRLYDSCLIFGKMVDHFFWLVFTSLYGYPGKKNVKMDLNTNLYNLRPNHPLQILWAGIREYNHFTCSGTQAYAEAQWSIVHGNLLWIERLRENNVMYWGPIWSITTYVHYDRTYNYIKENNRY